MNGLAVIFLLVNVFALLALPRRWAPLPLLAGACYITLGQGINVGPFYFSFIRTIIFAGLVRVVVRRERIDGKLISLDKVVIWWAVWAACSSFFHASPVDALVYRLGLIYNALGLYFLIRIFCRDSDDVIHLIKITAIVLTPVAFEMINEQLTGKNLFAIFGRVEEAVTVRSDRLRAQGPFSHAILAGTIGATCIPLMLGIWKQAPRAAKIGLFSSIVMVIASASSGPLMSAIFSILALVIWRWRHLTGQMRIGAVIAYLILEMIMSRPAYFVIAKFDLTGSSTGWHRAELIRSSIEHIDEWWIGGTDYTRHWMPTGVSWSLDQTDITSQYILNGVHGGMPLVLLFILILWIGFKYVGMLSDRYRNHNEQSARFAWTLGASLFAHAASCLSVAYFDQSFVFLYLTLAAIGSVYAGSRYVDVKVSECAL